ncbi:formate--tetrahydrofolate ligase [Ureaplasma miroungigenitalium]|uniref:formate--tetrahydrofolate ligase n=1 Tax=Ureaplasma miroungigenitalium TaxID=1042321 RepID=UPI0021E90B97|nr:formate--tetrahydrofolate ligase [Ureaplasma miroungigenitalium]MCV3734205.1 formate--tetrahydrofolate ligase [Ureaplasma miroungigenitalium]
MDKILNIIKNHELKVADYDLYGEYIAKIKAVSSKKDSCRSKTQTKCSSQKTKPSLIVVTAMNPNPAGEGKTTTSIGLVDCLNKHNVRAIGALREPSLGPVFGMKGTGSGGGCSKLEPFAKINLHFTGDLHAIATANNLIVAVLENEIYNKSPLNIDPQKILIKRCLDMNDRSLRKINYQIKQEQINTGFNITAACDLMALICLAQNKEDFQKQLKVTVVAYTYENHPVTIADLEIIESLMIILEDALYPNLVQTAENNPVLVHGGPFANIAHGCSSLIATNMAKELADVVVTECGFGADLGLEKFMNIKSQLGAVDVDLIGLVISLKTIRHHGTYQFDSQDSFAIIKNGFKNVLAHINHIQGYNIKYMAYINVNEVTDTPEELAFLEQLLDEHQIAHARSYAYAYGSQKSQEMFQKTMEQLNSSHNHLPVYLYDVKNDNVVDKINKIITHAYHAQKVIFSPEAQAQITNLSRQDWFVCMAKNPYSLTDDQTILNVPEPFDIHVSHIEFNNFANLLIVITSKIFRMPGLNKIPAAKNFIIK